jgi:hypothetical protein
VVDKHVCNLIIAGDVVCGPKPWQIWILTYAARLLNNALAGIGCIQAHVMAAAALAVVIPAERLATAAWAGMILAGDSAQLAAESHSGHPVLWGAVTWPLAESVPLR